jgi:MerR family transcriptional regulator/heat shock protein HspR
MQILYIIAILKKGKRMAMALLDNDKDVLPLSSIAELLSAKIRTLKMYEEKGLLPKKDGSVKKFYSINDIKPIAFVHYLASLKKINANGIKYICEILNSNMDENSRNEFFTRVESKMEALSGKDIEDAESI